MLLASYLEFLKWWQCQYSHILISSMNPFMLDSNFTFWFFATLSFLLDNSHFFFFNFYFFIFGCAGAFSSCSDRGLLFDAVHSFSLLRLLLLWNMSSRHTDFRSCSTWALLSPHVGAHKLSCSKGCLVLPDQANPCPLHWQANS